MIETRVNLDDLHDASLAGEPDLGFRVATSYEVNRKRGKAIAVYWPRGVGAKPTYFPILKRGLPFEIAKLHEGDEKAVLDFVSIWGVLGKEKVFMHDQGQSFLPWNHPDSEVVRNTAKAAIEFARPDDVEAEEYEPLDWIWGHAHGIEWILSVYEGLREGNEEEVNNAVRRLPRGETSGTHSLKCSIAWDGPISYEISVPIDLDAVEKTIRIIINHNLRGVTRLVTGHRRPDDRRVMYWDFRALIQYAYWHVANLFDGAPADWMNTALTPAIASCQECNAMFLRVDKRQRFCAPLPGRKQSRCQARSYKRRTRASAEGRYGGKE